MGKVLIIGCGGVASVAIHKCCQNSDVFEEICIASRTKSKCDALKAKLEGTTRTKITTRQVDADKVDELIALIREVQPDLVMNIALPYQDLTIMDACLACGVNYMDTANYEPEDTSKFEYKWQWAYRERFEKAGMIVAGRNPERDLVEIVELRNHPFFVAVQYHPEFKSRPNRPHPLFRDLVGAAVKHQKERNA